MKARKPYSGTAVCTIISKNYLHFARTLMGRLSQIHPDWQRYVLLVDELHGEFDPSQEPFSVVDVADLQLPNPAQFLFRYTILEANTAVKPWLINWLFENHGVDRVVYLDPDIYVYRRLSEVEAALERGALMVLTPHLTAELNDRLRPDETDILRAGCYNLGFVALQRHPQLRRFLSWWQRHLEFDCTVEFERGLFVDQKWFDLVPALYDDIAVLKHPSYNVAYWNLLTRRVTRRGQEFLVNAQPLVFFHFSGLDPAKPHNLSKHQNRFRWKDLGHVRTLIKQYCALVKGNGLQTYRSLKYAFGFFSDGRPILDEQRRAYRKDPGVQRLLGDSPFETGSEYFKEKHAEPAPAAVPTEYSKEEHATPAPAAVPTMRRGVPVFRALRRLTRSQAARNIRRTLKPIVHLFPGGLRHRVKLHLKSLLGEGPAPAGEPGEPTAAVAAAVSTTPPTTSDGPPILRLTKLTEGLNIVGYLRSEHGIGESARLCALAAEAAGLSFSLHDYNAGNNSRIADRTWEAKICRVNEHEVNLFHVNADQMPLAYETLGADFFQDRYNIGFWHWELPEFPDQWCPNFRYVNEVWVPTEFVRRAISRKSPVPVYRMPHAVHFRVAAGLRRMERGLPEGRFLFLTMYDTHSVQARKNPQAVIAAFRQAFANPQDVALVVKINNPASYPQEVAALKAQLQAVPGIVVLDRILTRQQVYDLEALCDCYVSLHRSEGFGLGLAESMFLGKPVIGTHWSGNVDFMDADNSCPVDYRLITLDRDYGPYQQGQVWADPDVEQAAWYMRRVVTDASWRQAIAARGQYTIRTEFSPQVVGATYRQRLATLSRHRGKASLPETRVA